MKKTFSFLLTFLLLFIFIFPTFADENGFSTYDMSYKGIAVYIDGNGITQQLDVTSACTKSSTTYNSVNCTVYGMGNSSSDFVAKSIIAHEITDLNSGHEYNIQFKYNSSLPSTTVFVCDLVFYSSDGSELKRQTLYDDFNMSSGWHTVDVDFKPDNSGFNSGYKSKIEFTFTNTSSILVYFRLSDTVQLTDKDDNSNWFQKIINAIKEIPVKLGNLGDNIGNWFSNLGDNIGGFFDVFWEKLSNSFSDIGNWFVELGDKISTKFQEISDNFTAFFEKFKPRVYVNFNWRRGIINSNTGEFVALDNNGLNSVIVSDFFEVYASDKYLLDVIDNTDDNIPYFFRIYKYDLSGSYLSYEDVSATTEYLLESGFQYCFQYSLSNSLPENSANDYVLVYADEGWLSAFGHYLLNGLKRLFIPADNFFNDKLDELAEFFREKLGVLFLPFELVGNVLELYNNIGEGSGILHLNEFKIKDNILFSSRDINLKELISNFSQELYNVSGVNLYDIYLAFIDVIIFLAFVRLIKNKYDKITGSLDIDMSNDIMNDRKHG